MFPRRDQNLDLQLDALKLAGCQRFFSEHASGASRERPELVKALAFCRAKDVLVIWKLDRLGRSLLDLVEIVGELKTRDIGFRSLNDQIDTTTAAGSLMLHIMAAFAEFERNVIRERTMAGLAAARARGRIGGRKPGVPHGPRKRVLIPGWQQELQA